jgi:hypothetical protein
MQCKRFYKCYERKMNTNAQRYRYVKRKHRSYRSQIPRRGILLITAFLRTCSVIGEDHKYIIKLKMSNTFQLRRYLSHLKTVDILAHSYIKHFLSD